MNINICLGKDDIKTNKCGLNYRINLPNGWELIFTKEAIEEFVNDVKALDELDKAAAESKDN